MDWQTEGFTHRITIADKSATTGQACKNGGMTIPRSVDSDIGTRTNPSAATYASFEHNCRHEREHKHGKGDAGGGDDDDPKLVGVAFAPLL